jgi:C4-dicarboxylate-specific signal transduction histidine kinase
LLLLPEFFAAKVVGGAVIETRKPLPPAVRLGLERNIPKLMPRGGSTGGGVIKDRFLFERDDHEIIIASVDDQSQDDVRTVLAVDTSAVRRHETALIHLSKLSSLGEMAAGVAHELSQPLNVIRMTVYNIKGSLKPLSEASDAIARLDRIEKQVDRAANILKRMREYARSPAQRAKLCQLSAVAQNVAQIKSKSLESSGISLRIKETADLHATIDPVSLEQVLLALISNAEDAIGTQQNDSRNNKREILVEINFGVDPGYALLSVENSGPLIPVELRDRIFEPFFTTKGSLGSSGLGLFAAFSIIRDAGGNLSLADGQICTRFEILIPAGDVA